MAPDGDAAIHAESSGLDEGSPIRELLIEQLRDLLHAEKQLLKALPRMARAARSHQLRSLLQTHLEETEVQAERLSDSLRLLGANTRAKPCKGMAGCWMKAMR